MYETETPRPFGFVIYPTGAVDTLDDGEYDTIHTALEGGWLEAVSAPGFLAYVDEEGKIKDLPVNRVATDYARLAGWVSDDVLCGPVVFLGPVDEEGNATAVTEDFLDIGDALSARYIMDAFGIPSSAVAAMLTAAAAGDTE